MVSLSESNNRICLSTLRGSKERREELVPEWVGVLLGEKFFTPCLVHEFAKKNDKTFFCLYCCASICSHCLFSHRNHCLLQIRRYVYHDVIRLCDAEKLLNCSLVQAYTTNSAKVVFLKERGIRRRPFRGSGNLCITCYRCLQPPYLFCSLSCKIHHQMTVKTEIHDHHENYHHLPLPSKCLSELQDTKKTPSSILDLHFPLMSTTTVANGNGVTVSISPTCTSAAISTTKLVKIKKKRSFVNSLTAVICQPSCFPVADIAVTVNRRKGVPQRSPLS